MVKLVVVIVGLFANCANYLELNMAPDLAAATNMWTISTDRADGHLWWWC